MKTQYGFTEFESINEFKKWLDSQKVKRKVNRLQVHHMWAPSYDNWKTDIALRRQKNTKDYHMKTNGWGDIAQHFSIFPNGHIVTGRNLEKDPIGITGWNTGAICCEIYGNFDKDKMTKEQKEAVIAFYGLLCKKFNITPSSNTIRYHAWFTAKGTYLGTYKKGSSTKTCPGLKFFGGNDIDSFNKNFLPEIKKYISGDKVSTTVSKPTSTSKEKKVRIDCDVLNVRENAGTKYKIVGKVKRNDAYTIVEEKNGWGLLKSKLGWISLEYTKLVK